MDTRWEFADIFHIKSLQCHLQNQMCNKKTPVILPVSEDSTQGQTDTNRLFINFFMGLILTIMIVGNSDRLYPFFNFKRAFLYGSLLFLRQDIPFSSF